MAQRLDIQGIDRFERTQQGFLRIPSTLSKVGVFAYRRADGKTIREFRPPQEVFAPQAVETSDTLPVTIGHPPGLITPDNVQKYKVGQVLGTAEPDGNYLAGTIQVETADSIQGVESGKLKELSCGYSVDIVDQAGEYMGQPYDCVQTNIRLNHVSLLPSGAGRQGADVGLRMDSADSAILITTGEDMTVKTAETSKQDAAEDQPKQDPTMCKISVDGEDFEVHPKVADAFCKMNDAIAAMAPKDPKAEEKTEPAAEAKSEPSAEASNPDPEEEKKKADAVEPEPKADKQDSHEPTTPTAEELEAKARQDAKEQELRFDAAVQVAAQSLVELVDQARKIVPKLDWKGKTARQIQEQALQARKIKHDGKSDEWVATAFELLPQIQQAPAKGLADLLIPSDHREDSREPTAEEKLAAARAKHEATYSGR